MTRWCAGSLLLPSAPAQRGEPSLWLIAAEEQAESAVQKRLLPALVLTHLKLPGITVLCCAAGNADMPKSSPFIEIHEKLTQRL